MSAKEDLNKLINDLKFKKFESTGGKDVIKNIQGELVDAMRPALNQLVRGVEQSVKDAIGNIKIQVPTTRVEIPDFPEFPQIPAPVVNYHPPSINIPKIEMPKEMDIKGWVGLMGVSLEKPLPVQLRTADGSPLNLLENLTTIVSGSGGGRGVVKVSAFDSSAYGQMLNADGRLRVETSDVSISGTIETKQVSGAVDSVIVNDILAVSTSFPVNQVSGSNWSVTASLDTTQAFYNGDNRLRVSVETGGSGLTDAELRASHLDVQQLSGSIDSVYVTGAAASTYAELLNADGRVKTEISTILGLNETNAGVLRTVQMTDSVSSVSATDFDIRDLVNASDSVSAYQVSGAVWSVSAALDSVSATSLYNADNRLRVSIETGGSGLTDAELRASTLDVKQVSGSIDSVKVTGFDVSVGAYILNADGTYRDTFPISGTVAVTGAPSSVFAVGPILHDAVDAGDAPVKIGGTAMQANPTAVSGGDIVRFTADDLGRQITRPIQVRDLISTAFVTITDSSEDTLLAGVASTFLDLIYVMAANESNAAVNLAFRTGTGGATMFELQVPASGTVGVSLQVPIPASEIAQAWTVQNTGSDNSNTTVNISALFSREI